MTALLVVFEVGKVLLTLALREEEVGELAIVTHELDHFKPPSGH